MGSKPLRRKPNDPFLHASERPPESHDVDFASLNLKYNLMAKPEFTIPAIGWSPKPKTTPNFPFLVQRAGVSESLPVYTDYKGGRTKVITIVRKISGNAEELKSEIEKVVGRKAEIRPGKIIIDGNYCMRLKKYLIGLGF